MVGHTWTVLVVYLMMVQHVKPFGWENNKSEDTTTCSLTAPDLQKITDVFTEVSSEGSNAVNISLVELDVKLQKIFDLLVVLRSVEESLQQEPQGESPVEAVDSFSVNNGTQEKDKIVEEPVNEEQPKQESLTDTLEELHGNETELLLDQEIPFVEKEQLSDIKGEKTPLNENTLMSKILPKDDDITLFRSSAHSNAVKKGGCEALVHNAHETIGMFFITSYRHGHCSNREPLTTNSIRYCLGYCSSKTFLDREAGHEWRQGHECYSCQAEDLEDVSIPLECEDGYTFHKNYRNVVTCKCNPCKSADITD